jgi:hypothetical protein
MAISYQRHNTPRVEMLLFTNSDETTCQSCKHLDQEWEAFARSSKYTFFPPVFTNRFDIQLTGTDSKVNDAFVKHDKIPKLPTIIRIGTDGKETMYWDEKDYNRHTLMKLAREG